jgi:MYXO-CTERM domain-containing protein
MRHVCSTRARALAFASLSCIALPALLPAPAGAGPVEQLVQVAMHPSDPQTLLLRYKFGGEGLFVSHDGGMTWGLVCNTFIDPSTSARNGVAAVGGDGALFLGVFGGLWQADEAGCGWEITSGVGERWVTDVAHDPEDPEVLYAVTANGGEGTENGILKRESGDSWSELGAQEEMLMIFRMYVVSTGSDSRRFVQSTTRGMLPRTIDGLETMVPNYVIRVSDDDAESFQEFSYVAPDDGSFFLAAVDPSNPDRMVAYVDRDESGGKADPVLVSLDGGQSFEPYLEVSDVSGIVITSDGRVLIGDRGVSDLDLPKGIWSAPSVEDEPTELVTDWAASCLGYHAATDVVYACNLTGVGRPFGTLDPETGDFTALAKLTEMQSMVQCEGVDMAEACRVQLCRDYCLVGHFPNAPLCEVYQSPSCGPCSDTPPGPACEIGSAGSGAAGAGGAAGSGSGGAGDAGRSGGAGDGEAGMTGEPGDEPEPDEADEDEDEGGCAVSEPGSSARSHAGAVLAALGIAALARGRRRRAH